MKFLLAKKVNMTQVFEENGTVSAVTVLQVVPAGKHSVSGVSLTPSVEEAGFSEGENVTVSGTTKGKGFQGVVKRHGFGGGRRSHGQKHSEREPGSIGGGARAGGRVAKGMRMAGRMGGDRMTFKNLRVVRILPETNEILVSGAIPGRRGSKVEVRSPSTSLEINKK